MAIHLETLRALHRSALTAGAAAAEIYGRATLGTRSSYFHGKMQHQEPVDLEEIELRLWSDPLRSARATVAAEAAMAAIPSLLAEAARATPCAVCAPIEHFRGIRPLSLDDPRWQSTSQAERREIAIEAERGGAKAAAHVEWMPMYLADTRTWRGLVIGPESAIDAYDTRMDLHSAVRASTGQMFQRSAATRTLATLASIPVGILLANAISSLTRHPVEEPDESVLIALPPHLSATLFEAIAQASLARNGPVLGALSWDEVALHEGFHIIDDGTLPGGLLSAAFDDRGVGPSPVVLIQGGRLHRTPVTLEESRNFGVEPTGHWRDGAPRLRNLSTRAGIRSLSATLTLTPHRVAWVEHLDSPVSLNPVTGALEFTVTGRWVRGARTLGSFWNMPVQGALSTAFGPDLVLTNDMDRVGHVDAISLLLGAMKPLLSGK